MKRVSLSHQQNIYRQIVVLTFARQLWSPCLAVFALANKVILLDLNACVVVGRFLSVGPNASQVMLRVGILTSGFEHRKLPECEEAQHPHSLHCAGECATLIQDSSSSVTKNDSRLFPAIERNAFFQIKL